MLVCCQGHSGNGCSFVARGTNRCWFVAMGTNRCSFVAFNTSVSLVQSLGGCGIYWYAALGRASR